eukprot:TRINITY_DN1710_c0_g1_i7.p1 TRINITY_DN1710_c0_g1~~TRINITY_DN1710_c0_g1_i7.p1  ORF type:complete len:130 (-),score=27.41 TRINITY_DN1710_c0_g1_i7:346-735(-)
MRGDMRERPGGNSRSSLLGIPQNGGTNSNLMQSANEDLLLEQNNKKVESLSLMTSSLKEVAIHIENGIKESNALLTNLDDNLGKTQNLLKGAMKKLEKVSKQAKGWHMCMLFLFVFFVIFFLYVFFMKR